MSRAYLQGQLAAAPVISDRSLLIIAGAGALLVFAFALAAAPWLAAGAAMGTLLLVLLLLRPLYVVAGTLVLGPVDLSFLTGGRKALLESAGGLDMNGIRLVAIVAGFSLLLLLDRKLMRLALAPNARWYALLLAFAGFTLAYSLAPMDGLRLLFKLAYPLLVFLAMLATIRTPEQLQKLGDLVLIAAAFFTIIVNPLYLLFGDAYLDDTVGARARGMGLHTGPWSYYLLIVIGICLVRFSVRRHLRYLVLALICGFWVVSTLTRTAAIAAVPALGFLAVYSGLAARNLRLSLAALVVGTGLALLLWTSFVEKTFGGQIPGPSDWLWLLRNPAQYASIIQISGREVLWAVAYAAFVSSPLIGIGLGSTTVLLQTQFTAEMGHVVHNEYLRLAAESGLVGLGLFVLALVGWWRAAWRAGAARLPLTNEWAMPAMAALIVWGITCLADNSIDYYAPVSQYVGFLCGGAVLAARFAAPDAESAS